MQVEVLSQALVNVGLDLSPDGSDLVIEHRYQLEVRGLKLRALIRGLLLVALQQNLLERLLHHLGVAVRVLLHYGAALIQLLEIAGVELLGVRVVIGKEVLCGCGLAADESALGEPAVRLLELLFLADRQQLTEALLLLLKLVLSGEPLVSARPLTPRQGGTLLLRLLAVVVLPRSLLAQVVLGELLLLLLGLLKAAWREATVAFRGFEVLVLLLEVEALAEGVLGRVLGLVAQEEGWSFQRGGLEDLALLL